MIGAPLAMLVLLASQATGSGTEVRAELQPLQHLVGSCWSARFPDGKRTDTHCFESVFGGRFIRDRHVVAGAGDPYQGETLYAWDAKQKKLVYSYWASDGGMSSGSAEPGAAGEITFREAYTAGAGGLELKTVWTRRDAEGYDVQVARKKDGEWQEMWRMSFKRDAPAQVAPVGETKKP